MVIFCLSFLFSGGFQLTVDGELLLHKAALVNIQVCHAIGMIELKFTKEPFSHWSVSLLPVSDAVDIDYACITIFHTPIFCPKFVIWTAPMSLIVVLP